VTKKPGEWSFSVEETSAGVYRARGVDSEGRTVETIGTDPDAALKDCTGAAAEMAELRELGHEADRPRGA
jgi:hypothetical protein